MGLCESLGVIVTYQPDTAVFCADALARWEAPKASDVTVLSGLGGAVALAADAIYESSFHIARLSKVAMEYLAQHLPLQKETADLDFRTDFRAFEPKVIIETLDIIADEADVGALLLVMISKPYMGSIFTAIRQIGLEIGVPALICNKAGILVQEYVEASEQESGYPVYTSLDDCYRVL